MINYFAAALGAALGGAFRYWLTGFVYIFPLGTLAVNFIGSLLLGVIIFSSMSSSL